MEFVKLQKDMMQAMKDRDKQRKDSISALVSAAKKLAIDAGCRDEIPEEMVDRAILKEVKSVKEQIETCPAARQDLLEEYKARLAVMEEYAPRMMGEAEIEALIKEKFAEVIASGNRGLIMKSVMQELNGKADGKLINKVVTAICSK